MTPETYARIQDIPRFSPRGSAYAVDVWPAAIERQLASMGELNGLDLDPDFQRIHVWNDEQRVRYMEYILRGGKYARDIYFNSENWHSGTNIVQLVDGKQRLETIRRFMRDELAVFGKRLSEFKDARTFTHDCAQTFRFHVYDLDRRGVLNLYYGLNYGGTPHTPEERAKVLALMEKGAPL